MSGINDTVSKCSKCDFEAPLSEWTHNANGKRWAWCDACIATGRQCSRCSYISPLHTWKRTPNGEVYKLFEKCCLWHRNKSKRIAAEKKENS